jgi:hypothetical protein
MVGLAGLVLLAVLVSVHTVVAAVAVRLLRVRFERRWTPVAAALVVVPMLLVASTLVVAGGLGLGPNLGNAGLAWFLLVVVPLGLGLAVDYLWMPAPEAVELPATGGG